MFQLEMCMEIRIRMKLNILKLKPITPNWMMGSTKSSNTFQQFYNKTDPFSMSAMCLFRKTQQIISLFSSYDTQMQAEHGILSYVQYDC